MATEVWFATRVFFLDCFVLFFFLSLFFIPLWHHYLFTFFFPIPYCTQLWRVSFLSLSPPLQLFFFIFSSVSLSSSVVFCRYQTSEKDLNHGKNHVFFFLSLYGKEKSTRKTRMSGIEKCHFLPVSSLLLCLSLIGASTTWPSRLLLPKESGHTAEQV